MYIHIHLTTQLFFSVCIINTSVYFASTIKSSMCWEAGFDPLYLVNVLNSVCGTDRRRCAIKNTKVTVDNLALHSASVRGKKLSSTGHKLFHLTKTNECMKLFFSAKALFSSRLQTKERSLYIYFFIVFCLPPFFMSFQYYYDIVPAKEEHLSIT